MRLGFGSSPPPTGSPCKREEPNPPCTVPLAKREEPPPLHGSPRKAGGTSRRGETNPHPLLQVPPASRGNQTLARFPSQSGRNRIPPCTVPLAKRGEPHGGGETNPHPLLQVPPASRGNRTPPCTVPLAKRGEPNPPLHGSPRRAGGTSRRGETNPHPLLQVPPASRGNRPPLHGSPRKAGGTEPPCTVPLTKREEPHGGGKQTFTYHCPRLNAWFSSSRRVRISRRASGETVKRV
jgi:hypothetical protein